VGSATAASGDERDEVDAAFQMGAHDIADGGERSLANELGELAPAHDAIHTHVHIGDVTGDPRDLLRHAISPPAGNSTT